MTLLEPAGPPGIHGVPLRAQLRLGSFTLARQQLSVLLGLGCERVICVAHALDAEVGAAQRVAEAAGARFHIVSGPRGLIGQVAAQDDLIALADGLMAWSDTVSALLEPGSVVVAQPVEAGLAAGFERFDATYASAGAFRIPGRLVERLAELPPDCDTFSALQRIALQAGVSWRELPEHAVAEGRWRLLRSEAEAQALEAAWIRLHSAIEGGGNVSLLAAQALVRKFGPALLHAGTGSRAVAMVGFAVGLLSLLAGWFGHGVIALVMAALAWLVLVGAVLLGRVVRETLRLPAPRLRRGLAYGWLADAGLVLLLAWSQADWQVPAAQPPGWIVRGFVPLMLVGLWRLLAGTLPAPLGRWFEDRALLALVAALALSSGQGGVLLRVLALLGLATGLVAQQRRTKANAGLTPDR